MSFPVLSRSGDAKPQGRSLSPPKSGGPKARRTPGLGHKVTFPLAAERGPAVLGLCARLSPSARGAGEDGDTRAPGPDGTGAGTRRGPRTPARPRGRPESAPAALSMPSRGPGRSFLFCFSFFLSSFSVSGLE